VSIDGLQAIAGKIIAQERQQKPSMLDCKIFLPRVRHFFISDILNCGLMLSQFKHITTRQFDIAVQGVQCILAYAFHGFPFTVRNDSFK